MYAIIETSARCASSTPSPWSAGATSPWRRPSRPSSDFQARLQVALDETRQSAPPKPTALPTAVPPTESSVPTVRTGVPRDELERLVVDGHRRARGLHRPSQAGPAVRAAGRRWWPSGEVDWALGEALAFGSVAARGHRRAADRARTPGGGPSASATPCSSTTRTGEEWVPLAHLTGEDVGRFAVHDSLLSEYAALGFEYGYSVEAPDALVAWEAQFGDFANGAQIIIDNFLRGGRRQVGTAVGPGPAASRTATRARGPSTPRPGSSGSSPCAPGATCGWPNPPPPRSTSTSCAPRCAAWAVSRWWCSPRSPCLRARQSRSPLLELTHAGSFPRWSTIRPPAATQLPAPVRVRAVVGGPGRRAPGPAVLGQDGLRPHGAGVSTARWPRRRAAGLRRRPAAAVAVVRVEQLYPWPEEALAAVLGRYPTPSRWCGSRRSPRTWGRGRSPTGGCTGSCATASP